MKAKLTDAGALVLWNELGNQFERKPSAREFVNAMKQIEASVDRALTPTAEIRQHTNGTCWCRYVTIPEEYVEWVG